MLCHFKLIFNKFSWKLIALHLQYLSKKKQARSTAASILKQLNYHHHYQHHIHHFYSGSVSSESGTAGFWDSWF